MQIFIFPLYLQYKNSCWRKPQLIISLPFLEAVQACYGRWRNVGCAHRHYRLGYGVRQGTEPYWGRRIPSTPPEATHATAPAHASSVHGSANHSTCAWPGVAPTNGHGTTPRRDAARRFGRRGDADRPADAAVARRYGSGATERPAGGLSLRHFHAPLRQSRRGDGSTGSRRIAVHPIAVSVEGSGSTGHGHFAFTGERGHHVKSIARPNAHWQVNNSQRKIWEAFYRIVSLVDSVLNPAPSKQRL